MSDSRLKEIRQALESAFSPVYLHIEDESWKHAGHAGAAGGGGHFAVQITAASFTGKSRIERHRMVFNALKKNFEPAIHALSIKARSPDETIPPELK